MKRIIVLIIAIFTISIASAQQINVTGSAFATSTPDCYTLTNSSSQAGAVWDMYKLDLTQPFDITLTLNFGNRPDTNYTADTTCGGAGMAFILQPSTTAMLQPGSGMGFHGITPSLGVLMDTYHYDAGDPPYDHISINKNGDESDISANELTSYTTAVGLLPTFTDGLNHLFRVIWTPTSNTLNVYLGTATTFPPTPTIAYTGDIINDIFSGNPNVYWGIAASTGGCWNNQSVCIPIAANFTADTIACTGFPVHFYDNSVSDTTITSWSWGFGDGVFSYYQNPIEYFSTPGTYPIHLYIVNSNGASSAIWHTVTVNATPEITNITDTIPNGSTFTITPVDSINGVVPAGTTYSWPYPSTPGLILGLASGNGAANISGTLINNTSIPETVVYAVSTISGNGCYGDTFFVSIIVLPGCTANFTLVADTTTPHHYYAVNNAWGIPPLKYIWSWGDGTQDTIAYPSHTYSVAGYYKICLTITDSNGCTNTYCDSSYLQKSTNSMITVNVIPHGTLGINENESSNQIKVYPNPAKDILTIETNSNKEQRIDIINLIGQTIYTNIINKKAIINTSAFANGVYILKLSSDKETIVKKFVKE